MALGNPLITACVEEGTYLVFNLSSVLSPNKNILSVCLDTYSFVQNPSYFSTLVPTGKPGTFLTNEDIEYRCTGFPCAKDIPAHLAPIFGSVNSFQFFHPSACANSFNS